MESGLTDSEVELTQSKYGFQFPPDLRELLQHALPIGPMFPNWRDERDDLIKEQLSWPLEGILFDIERNGFWMEEWGPKPNDSAAAFEIARQAVARAPRLIPVYGHRYIPDEPQLAGNPVFSAHQTDIIYYGGNLAHYFANEFRPGVYRWSEEHERTVRKIRFWSRLVDMNNGL